MLDFHPGVHPSAQSYSGRVVLAEVFTGSECPPCAGSDAAFDLLASYYPRSMLVIIKHHIHIPAPDALANDSSLSRYQYYGADFGAPMAFLDGKRLPFAGGIELLKRDIFYRYRSRIEKRLSESDLALGLGAQLEGDAVRVALKVRHDRPASQTVRLNLALLENSVSYAGYSLTANHSFVVRHLETILSKGDHTDSQDASWNVVRSVDLKEVERQLRQYLDGFETNLPDSFQGFGGWRRRPVEIDRGNLAVAAWLEDVQTKEVLQAAYTELKR